MGAPATGRIAWIDAAKGFCILAVVLYHFNLYIYHPMPTGTTNVAVIWQILISAMKPIRMPLFFLISGYLAYSGVFNKTWAAVRTTRIASLLWVYALWFSCYWIFNFYHGALNPWFQPESGISYSFENFILQMATGKSGLWYLYALVIYFLLTRLLKKSLFATMAVGLCLAQLASLWEGNNTWNYQSLASYFIYFAIGVHFRSSITQHFARFDRRYLVTSIVLAVIAMGLSRLFYDYYFGVFQIITGLLACAAAAQVFAWLCQRFKMRWLREIGRRTLPIYVLHMFFIYLLAPVLPVVTHPLWLLLIPVVMAIVIPAASMALYHIILKLTGRWTFTMPHTFRQVAYRTSLLRPA